MRDIQHRIYRPVALPQRFFAVPMLPAFFNFAASILLFVSLVMLEMPLQPIPLFGGIIAHCVLLVAGSREPHMTTLLQTWRHTLAAPRNLGRRSRKRIFHP